MTDHASFEDLPDQRSRMARLNELAAKDVDAMKAEGLRRAFLHFLGCALTVKRENTPEWMEYFHQELIHAHRALGDTDLVMLEGGQFRTEER